MGIIKTPQQIEGIRESCRRVAIVLAAVAERVRPGISTRELDDYAFDMIKDMGDKPSFLNYKPHGSKTPFSGTLCISINNEVVHGLPSSDRILQEGDIVSLDCGINHNGFFSDHAITVPVGEISVEDKKLLNITREALMIGIKAAQPGNYTGDIGHAIESFVGDRYGIVTSLAGHGVGLDVHEDPYVPNYGEPKTGMKLLPGMVLAIEPMLNIGGDDVKLERDGWTFVTVDGTRSAHFEHTIVITENGPEILTKI